MRRVLHGLFNRLLQWNDLRAGQHGRHVRRERRGLRGVQRRQYLHRRVVRCGLRPDAVSDRLLRRHVM